MSPVTITVLVLVGVVLLLALWLMGIYNGLVVAANRFKNAFAQIDVQLKRRYELIPNLVEAVKGYMAHERETLDAVIKARNSAMAAEQKVAANPSDPAAIRELNLRPRVSWAASWAGSSPCPRRTRTSRPTRTCSPCRRN